MLEKKCIICEKKFVTNYERVNTCSIYCRKKNIIKNASILYHKNIEFSRLKGREKYKRCKKTIMANRIKHKEKFTNYLKSYYVKNKTDYHNRSMNWYHKNKDKHNKNQRIRSCERRKTDTSFKIINNLRTRIYITIRENSGKKAYRAIELLGCTIQECRNYLENKFKEGMTWGNYGLYGWHIDHIIPCNNFDLTNPEEQKKCFHYTNLQPLWAKENLYKSNKLNFVIEEKNETMV
jgi:hypothetical protein